MRWTDEHQDAVFIDALNVSRWDVEVFRSLHEGRLTAINATVAVWEGAAETVRQIGRWKRLFKEHADLVRPVTCPQDILAARDEGRCGVILGFQNASPVEDEIDLLDVYHALGVRCIQLAFNDRNFCGDGCYEPSDAGLSSFGREVITRMNDLGLLLDLSHVGLKTSIQAVDSSSRPAAITHANPSALVEHPRNKPDHLIKAVAARGGVIGATAFPSFLPKGFESTIEDFVDVIVYLVNLVGVDHVGIGCDFVQNQDREFFRRLCFGKRKADPVLTLPYPVPYPQGLSSPVDFPNVAERLSARGYGEDEIRNIMGENFLRLFRQVWGSSNASTTDA